LDVLIVFSFFVVWFTKLLVPQTI